MRNWSERQIQIQPGKRRLCRIPDSQEAPWDGVSIIGEVKNQDNAPFSNNEAREFLDKMATLKEMEHITDAIGFVYSRSGFTTSALTILQDHQIAYSDDDRWLE